MLPDFDDEFAGVSEYANLYRQLGLQVVPAVYPYRNKNWKRPDLKGWKEFTNELVSDEQFEQWFGPGRCSSKTNLGILTGMCSGGVFVVDLDTHKNPDSQIWWDGIHADHTAGIMPDCPTQRTGGGGLQMLFRSPEGWTPPTIKTSLGVDIRGQGGFAVIAPSMHDSGRHYEWLEDRGPSVLEIPLAEKYLCDEIDALAARYGHTTNVDGERVRTESPPQETDEWGKLINGREDRMYRMIFKCILDLYRECPFIDPQTEAQAKMDCFSSYVDAVETRIREIGTPKHVLLEREGRGKTLFDQKWRSTMRSWDTKISEEAQKPYERFQSDNFNKNEGGSWSSEGGGDSDDFDSESADPDQRPEGLFRVYRKSDLEKLPPAEFIIEGLIQRYGSNYVTGWPGSGKSFYLMGACIAISTGQESFLGKKVNVHGPIVYVTTEGIHDHYTRMRAYEEEYKVTVDEERYLVIPDAMNLMQNGDLYRLLKTIEWEMRRMKDPPVMVVFDTVSRVIPGADENNQKEMSLFVKAETQVQHYFNTTSVLAHHLSRSGNGNMRGSTVLEGSADTIIVLKREPGQEYGIIIAAKMKSAPDGWELEFRLKTVSIDGFASSLVIGEATHRPSDPGFGGSQETGFFHFGDRNKLPNEKRDLILTKINDDWWSSEPWSYQHQNKNDRRYFPRRIRDVLAKPKMTDSVIKSLYDALINSQWVKINVRDKNTDLRGLQLVNDPRNACGSRQSTSADKESENNDL